MDGWQYYEQDGLPIYQKSDRTNTVSVRVYQCSRNGQLLDRWQVDWENANGDVDGCDCATEERAFEYAEIILAEMIEKLSRIQD